MYTFTRSVRLGSGHLRDSMAWAVEITEKVNQISETPFTLWRPLFSPRVTTLTWGTLVEDLEELEAVDAKLMADDTYVALADKGATFVSGDAIDDSLVSYVHGDFTHAGEVQYLAIVQAVMIPGGFAKGVEVGVEIAQRAEGITGLQTAFGIATTGLYGTVQWLSGYASVAELQRAETAINTDPSFVAYLDAEASAVFTPGEQRIARRIL